MKLHTNEELFRDAIGFASMPTVNGGLGISPLLIEKDYWICRSLCLMTKGDPDGRSVFKGGTSLSKAYSIGFRFSEDIDVAISETQKLSGNQIKNLIKKTAHNMTEGLEEFEVPNKTSKGSRYHKAFYRYPRITEQQTASSINPGQLLIEINSFANPYPAIKCKVESFLTSFLIASGNSNIAEEYEMMPFVVPVLDKRVTLTEKIVSLIRNSLANEYIPQLSSKIRHFYDIYYLLNDKEISEYIQNGPFLQDFNALFEHDRQLFSKPEGWKGRNPVESPLLLSLENVWQKLEPVYRKELPELAYREIPSSGQIIESVRTIIGKLI